MEEGTIRKGGVNERPTIPPPPPPKGQGGKDDYFEALELLEDAFFQMAAAVQINGKTWYDSMANKTIEALGSFLVERGIFIAMTRGTLYYRKVEAGDL